MSHARIFLASLADHPTPSRPCHGCSVCVAPGPRVCSAQAGYEADEDYYEQVDDCHDAHRAASFAASPNRPPGEYRSRAYPTTVKGALIDDPARSWL